MTRASALAHVHFPTPPGELTPDEWEDLVIALEELTQRLRAGLHRTTGTLTVPNQRRHAMKVSFEYSGQQGKAFEFDCRYHQLPPEYLLEVAAACRSLATWIGDLKGGAAAGRGVGGQANRAYAVKFEYKADEIPAAMEDLYSAKVEAKDLLYSQVVQAQEAGLKLLERLLEGAKIEIAAGQRS